MKNHTIAIVGATGKTGARVSTLLRAEGYATRDLSRSGEYHFDWMNRDSWKPALEGVEAAYITYYPDLAVPQAESDIRAFVDLAHTLAIKHLVLLSGRGEEGAQHAEAVIKTSGIDWNIVQASWFMQNFSESFMLEGLNAGNLVLPEPKALEPFIDVDDIAEMAVAALTRSELRNQLFEITGPELRSFDHCVALIAQSKNRDISFTTVSIEDYLSGAKELGLSDDFAWLIQELFVNVLDGRNAYTTDTIARVLGRPARTFQSYVEKVSQDDTWTSVV